MKSLILFSLLLSSSVAFAGGSCKYNIRTFIPGGMMHSEGSNKGTSMNYEKCQKIVADSMGDVEFNQLGLVEFEGKIGKQKGRFYFQYQFDAQSKSVANASITVEEYKAMMKQYFGVDVK